MSENEKEQDFISVWEYFDKIGDDKERKASCRYCKKIYCYKTTIYNLKHHLLKKHSDDFHINPELLKNVICSRRRPEFMTCLRGPLLWNYFEQCDDNTASCIFCKKLLSYKSNQWNLKSHLKRVHSEVYEKLRVAEDEDEQQGKGEESNEVNAEETFVTLDDDNGDTNPLSTTEVWNFFERETGGRARCVLCKTSVAAQEEDMTDHVRAKHPKLINEELSDNEDEEASRSFIDDNPNTFSEIIYLETDQKEKKRSREHRKSHSAPIHKKSRRQSSSDEEYLLPRKLKVQSEAKKYNKHDFEVDNFMKYLSSLLKEVPSDQFIKLQMDIINLVMMARIKNVPVRKETVTSRVNEVIPKNAKIIYEYTDKGETAEADEPTYVISLPPSAQNSAVDNGIKYVIHKSARKKHSNVVGNRILVKENTYTTIEQDDIEDNDTIQNIDNTNSNHKHDVNVPQSDDIEETTEISHDNVEDIETEYDMHETDRSPNISISTNRTPTKHIVITRPATNNSNR